MVHDESPTALYSPPWVAMNLLKEASGILIRIRPVRSRTAAGRACPVPARRRRPAPPLPPGVQSYPPLPPPTNPSPPVSCTPTMSHLDSVTLQTDCPS